MLISEDNGYYYIPDPIRNAMLISEDNGYYYIPDPILRTAIKNSLIIK